MKNKVVIYALSTCGWCHKTLQWMENNKVECEKIYVDQLSGAERENVMKEVEKYNPRRSFPTVVLNDGTKVIIGYKPEEFEKELL